MNNFLKTNILDQSHVAGKKLFYIGGKYTGEVQKQFMHNQMFVEAYFPKEVKYKYPLVFFHGAGQTNVCWLTTPDSKLGWADYFLLEGFIVCLVEQPSRGRSAYHPEINGERIYHSAELLKNRFASKEGRWNTANLHTQWPEESAGIQGEVFKQFASSQVEYLKSNEEIQKIVLEDAADLFQKIGEAVLITHSQGSTLGWLLADRYPKFVKGIVAIEPSGPPFGLDLDKKNPSSLGIVDLPLTFEPPVLDISEIEIEVIDNDRSEKPRGFAMKEPARKLPNFANIPVSIIVGEASYHSDFDYFTSHFLSQAGVENDYIPLEGVGIRGNGHMLMLEKNNKDSAVFIANWIKNTVLY